MSTFDRFLATNKSHAQIQEIYRARDKLGIADNDALWTVMIMTTPVMELPGLIEAQIVAVKAMSDTFMASFGERAQAFSDLIEKIFNDGAEAGTAAVARNASETADKAVGLLAAYLPAHLSAMSQPIIAMVETHGAAMTASALAITKSAHKKAETRAARAEARTALPLALIFVFLASIIWIAGSISGTMSVTEGTMNFAAAATYFQASLEGGIGFPSIIALGLIGMSVSFSDDKETWQTLLCSLTIFSGIAGMIILIAVPVIQFLYEPNPARLPLPIYLPGADR